MEVNKSIEKQLKGSIESWKSSGGEQAGGTAAPGEEAEEFEETVAKREFELLDMEVQDLVEELTVRGDNLKEKQTPKNARRYKQALASFLDKALKMSRKVRVREGKRSLSLADLKKQDEKKHRIVEKIDERVDRLTDAVLEQQEDKIDVAEHVDEVKGLVVDLVSAVKEPLP